MASNKVDLPLPFYPTKKVTAREKASRLRPRRDGISRR